MRETDDVGQFEAVYNRHKTGIYNFCLRMLNDSDDAKDVVQEVFMRYFETLAKFDNEVSVKVWLFKSARNRCLNIIRDNTKLSNSAVVDGDRFPGAASLDTDYRDAQDIVRNLFREMSPDYREVLSLREWDELSYDEIGRTLEITVGAVKSRLFKARKEAADIYRKLYGE